MYTLPDSDQSSSAPTAALVQATTIHLSHLPYYYSLLTGLHASCLSTTYSILNKKWSFSNTSQIRSLLCPKPSLALQVSQHKT